MASNWAIVIGINDYQHHPERRLKYAVNDAQRMSHFLTHQAGFDAEKVILCLGDQAYRDSATYPTCDNLLRLLKRDLKTDRLGKINQLWFYFSGHGANHNGCDYLITSNCLEDEIERFALPIDEVIAALRSHQDSDIVLILDACRQLLGKKSFDSSIGKQTITFAKEGGITTIFSCDYGQYSYELEALQQGAFTYALIEGLAQHTLPHQLEIYLRERVPALHLQHRRDRVNQTPRIRIEPTSKAFHPLLPAAVTPADIAVLVDLARRSELEEDFETSKQIWWQIIRFAKSDDRIQEAENAVRRIDQKTGNRSAHARSIVNHQLTRQRFLKLVIPAGVGVVGVSLTSFFLGQSPQPSPSLTSEKSSNPQPKPSNPQPKPSQSPQPSPSQTSQSPQPSPSQTSEKPYSPQPKPSSAEPTPSTVAVDYSRLEEFLKAGKWKDANQETANLLLKVAKREQQNFLDANSIMSLPCRVLSEIDRLWVDNSGGKFGFSIQHEIYVECGFKPEDIGSDAGDCFLDRVKWWGKQGGPLYLYDATFSSTMPRGHLPLYTLATTGRGVGVGWNVFIDRLRSCSI